MPGLLIDPPSKDTAPVVIQDLALIISSLDLYTCKFKKRL